MSDARAPRSTIERKNPFTVESGTSFTAKAMELDRLKVVQKAHRAFCNDKSGASCIFTAPRNPSITSHSLQIFSRWLSSKAEKIGQMLVKILQGIHPLKQLVVALEKPHVRGTDDSLVLADQPP